MGKCFWRPAGLVFAVIMAMTAPSSASTESIAVSGTGAATEFLRRLSAEFGVRTGIRVEVIPSMGSSGAIRAAGDGILDIAVSGQPLGAEAVAKGLRVAFTLRTPFVFATSHPRPQPMTLTEIAHAYEAPGKTWPDGQLIRVILRPRLDGDTMMMERMFPSLAAAMAAARKRPDVPVAATDQDNAMLAELTPGSLIGTTFLQTRLENRNLRFITLEGVEPTLENFDSGVYSHAKNLAFVVTAQPKPATERFLAFVRSTEGEALFRQAHGY